MISTINGIVCIMNQPGIYLFSCKGNGWAPNKNSRLHINAVQRWSLQKWMSEIGRMNTFAYHVKNRQTAEMIICKL